MKRFLISILVWGLFATSVSAVEYEDIRNGQTYDFDVFGAFTNPRAVVLRKSLGRIKIEIIEGDRRGEVIWVSPSDLLTTDESRKQEAENIGTGIVVGIGIWCAISGTCEDSGSSSAPPPSTVRLPEDTSDDGFVYLKNNCQHQLDFYFAYYRDGEFYGSDRGWTIDGNQRTQLLLSSSSPVKTDKQDIFFFAESPAGWEWSGDKKITLGSREFSMRTTQMQSVSNGYEVGLSCDE